MMIKINVPPAVENIMRHLENSGHECYIVGGAVRDALMGIEPHDLDIACSAIPSEIAQIMEAGGWRVVPMGVEYGVQVIIGEDGEPYEIASFRKDIFQQGAKRRECEVVYGASLIEDLHRRDFYFNAIAYHPERGIIDPLNGSEDIQMRIVRFVGNPAHRIEEDPSRMIRAFRFSAQCDFSIDGESFSAIFDNSDKVCRVSPERFRSEFEKIIVSEHVGMAQGMWDSGIAQHFMKNVSIFNWREISSAPADVAIRFCVLLARNGISNPVSVAREMRFENPFVTRVAAIFRGLDMDIEYGRDGVKRMMSKMGEDIFFDVMAVWQAVGVDVSWLVAEASHVIECGEPFSIRHLSVNGNDILPFAKGEMVGKILRDLLNIVISEPHMNEKNFLMEHVSKMVEK